MDDERLIRTELEFAVADAVWRHELAAIFGDAVNEDDLTAEERRGETGSTLRSAFEDRKASLSAFRSARGTV